MAFATFERAFALEGNPRFEQSKRAQGTESRTSIEAARVAGTHSKALTRTEGIGHGKFLFFLFGQLEAVLCDSAIGEKGALVGAAQPLRRPRPAQLLVDLASLAALHEFDHDLPCPAHAAEIEALVVDEVDLPHLGIPRRAHANPRQLANVEHARPGD
jgi:hypothetical protein